MVDLTIMNSIAETFSHSAIWIVGAGILAFILGVLFSGDLKRKWYNFNRTRYVEIEIMHDGIVRDVLLFAANSIKNNEFLYKGVMRKLIEVSNPINTSAYSKRYTFNNDNIFPNVNIVGDAPATLTGINSFEILNKRTVKSKTGEEKDIFYVMTGEFWKNLLDTHFVSKIKAEKKNQMEAILEFLQSPSGLILMLIAAAFVVLQMAGSLFR